MNQPQIFDPVAFAREHVNNSVWVIDDYDFGTQDKVEDESSDVIVEEVTDTVSRTDMQMYLSGVIGGAIQEGMLEGVDGDISALISRINALQHEYDAQADDWSTGDYDDYDAVWTDFLETGWSEGIADKIIKRDYPDLFSSVEEQIRRIFLTRTDDSSDVY